VPQDLSVLSCHDIKYILSYVVVKLIVQEWQDNYVLIPIIVVMGKLLRKVCIIILIVISHFIAFSAFMCFCLFHHCKLIWCSCVLLLTVCSASHNGFCRLQFIKEVLFATPFCSKSFSYRWWRLNRHPIYLVTSGCCYFHSFLSQAFVHSHERSSVKLYGLLD